MLSLDHSYPQRPQNSPSPGRNPCSGTKCKHSTTPRLKPQHHPHRSPTQAPLHTSTTHNILEPPPQLHSVTRPVQSLPLPLSSDHQSVATFTLSQQEHKPLPSHSQQQERPFSLYSKDHGHAWSGNGATEYPK